MISSISSSSRAGLALFLVLAACAGASGGGRATAVAAPRVAVLPLTNQSGTPVPTTELGEALERALAEAGLEVVGGAAVSDWLAQHRIRWVAGVDGATAQAARDELGVEAVVVPSVELFGAADPPRFGLAVRLVEAAEGARLLWADARFRAGDDSPGLLGLGIERDAARVRRHVLREVAGPLARFLSGDREPAATACPAESRFEPRIAFRAPLDPARTYSIAVLPFRNETDRAHADEAVALQLVRQLHAARRFSVFEPGVVREKLLGNRIVMEGGVSLETARLVLGSMEADLIVTGTVQRYEDGPGASSARVAYSVVVLDTRERRIVWRSTSEDSGDEGLRLFDRRRVRVAADLACRMARHVVDGLGTDAR